MGKQAQHFIPNVYLKCFSANDDGKGVFVFKKENKKFDIKASTDSIFCGKNYYNLPDSRSKRLEETFGDIETDYPKLISRIQTENSIGEFESKEYMLAWLTASILRSPSKRALAERVLEHEHLIFRAYPDNKFFSNAPYKDENDKKLKAKEIHLSVFIDDKKMDDFQSELIRFTLFKRWEILIAPVNRNWITSDRPGFLGSYSSEENSLQITPAWDFSYSDFMYYPLTKKYCLHIHEGYENDYMLRAKFSTLNVKKVFEDYGHDDGCEQLLNLTNTPIVFRTATDQESNLINKWTFATMHNLLIAESKDEFVKLEETIQEIWTEISQKNN